MTATELKVGSEFYLPYVAQGLLLTLYFIFILFVYYVYFVQMCSDICMCLINEYELMFCLLCDVMLARYMLSSCVRLSVRPSVTSWRCSTKMAKRRGGGLLGSSECTPFVDHF